MSLASFPNTKQRVPSYRLTVEQYHEMLARGIVTEGEPLELLEGQILPKDRSANGGNPMTVGTRHATAVTRIGELSSRLKRSGCFVRIQQPLTLAPFNEPEPDAAIVAGNPDDYVQSHPNARHTLCVIEVADASLQRDRVIKQQIYADAGIKQYVIINLADKVIEVYTQPLKEQGRYGRSETLKPGRQLTLATAKGAGLSLPVRRLLP